MGNHVRHSFMRGIVVPQKLPQYSILRAEHGCPLFFFDTGPFGMEGYRCMQVMIPLKR